MNVFLTALGHLITNLEGWHEAHMGREAFGGGAFMIAMISTAPEVWPKSWQDWWCWIRIALQTVIPIKVRQPQSPAAVYTTTPPQPQGVNV